MTRLTKTTLALSRFLTLALALWGVAGCGDDTARMNANTPWSNPDGGIPGSDAGRDVGGDSGGTPGDDAGSVAEPGLPVWSELFRNARGNTVSLAPNGDVVVAGYLRQPVDFGAGPTEDDTAGYLVRFAPDGAYRWARTFDGPVFPHASVVDDDGNVFIAGSFRGSVTFGGESLYGGTYDGESRSQAFVASFDQDGNHRWSADYGSGNHDHLSSIALSSGGSIVVTGSAFGSIDFGGGNLPAVGRFGSNVVVASFNGNGEHRWSHLFGTNGELELDEGKGIAATPDGGVIITGRAHGGIDFGGGELAEDSPRTSHMFVAEFDARGDHRFSRLVEPTAPFSRVSVEDIAVSPSGDSFFLTGAESGRPFLASYSMEGELAWSLVGSGAGYGAELVADGAGVALVGLGDEAMSLGGASFEGNGSYFFVLSVDEAGVERWSTTLDATDHEAVVRYPALAISPTQLAVTGTLGEGESFFDDARVSLEDEGMFVAVFTR